MKLSLELISACLSDSYTVKYYGSDTHILDLERPSIYIEGCRMSPEIPLLISCNDLKHISQSTDSAIICVGRNLPSHWKFGNHTLLHIVNDINPIEVFNKIQEIYNHFDKWELSLRDELTEDSPDIRKIMSLGAAVLKKNIGIMDFSLHVPFSMILFSDDTESGLTEDTAFPVQMDLDDTEDIKNVCHIERKIQKPYISSAHHGCNKYYCYNIYFLDHFIGTIYIGDTVKFPYHSHEFPLADFYISILEKAYLKFLKHQTADDNGILTSLQKLIEGLSLSQSEAEDFILPEGCGWMCFYLKKLPGRRAMPGDYMASVLNMFLPQTAYALVIGDSVAGILCKSEAEDGTNGSFLDKFQNIVEKMEYTAGLSDRFTSIEKFRDYFSQAMFSAEKYDASSSAVLYSFDDYRLLYLLTACTEALPESSLFSEGLAALARRDRQKGSDYIHTLDIYLKNEMNISKTASELYIQRSSLVKRIKNIIKILGDDLTNAESRLYYRVCLSIIEKGLAGIPAGETP